MVKYRIVRFLLTNQTKLAIAILCTQDKSNLRYSVAVAKNNGTISSKPMATIEYVPYNTQHITHHLLLEKKIIKIRNERKTSIINSFKQAKYIYDISFLSFS